MSNPFTPKAHPVWGLPPHHSIADFPPAYQPKPVPVLDSVLVNTTSPAVEMGARGVKLTCAFEVADATCDVSLLAVTDAGDVVVKSWTGVKYSSALFAGNYERVDLGGKPIKVAVSNISSGWVTVTAQVLY